MKKSSPKLVHKTALDAWAHFCDGCGLEPCGRDAGFVEELRGKLDPGAPDTESALENATTDALIRAIFECVAPFVMMSRDILEFFRRAGARRGRQQWALVIDDVPFDLQNFVEFVSQANARLGRVERVVLDPDHAFDLTNLFPRASRVSLGPDVEVWCKEFWATKRYSPWPASLDPVALPSELQSAAHLARAALARIRSTGMTQPEFVSLKSRPADAVARSELHGLAAIENDHWVRNMIEGIAQAKGLATSELVFLGDRLAEALATLPRVLATEPVHLEDLTKILSLPVWTRRHEVYSIWIATQIVSALPPEATTIKHENGEIRFAFKKTEVARVDGPTGELILYSERKRPLTKPLGPGRKNNVQPDYGLWRERDDVCALVVEVKHYAEAASRSFTEALIDYARAHDKAQAVLVNHGPTRDMLDLLDEPTNPVAKRCHHIADLTPLNPDAQHRLKHFVREAFDKLSIGDRRTVIDVSHSMRSSLRSTSFKGWLEAAKERLAGDVVTLVDDKVRWQGSRTKALAWLASHTGWTGEDLAPLARELLLTAETLDFITDGEGYRGLQQAEDLTVELDLRGSPPGLILAVVRSR